MSSPPPRDETIDLLRRWHAGDRLALEQLLERHRDTLHAAVRARLAQQFGDLRRDQDSMDLVQGAFARVLEYIPRFIPENGAQFQALLRQFVLNDLRNQTRSPQQSRRESTRESFGDSVVDLRAAGRAGPAPDQAAESAERQDMLRALARIALEFLTDEGDRQLLLLAAVEEWSWEDIGLELGTTASAARMRYQRLLPRLANHVRMLEEGRVDELLAGDRP